MAERPATGIGRGRQRLWCDAVSASALAAARLRPYGRRGAAAGDGEAASPPGCAVAARCHHDRDPPATGVESLSATAARTWRAARLGGISGRHSKPVEADNDAHL